MSASVFHADLDAFFASVEQLDHVELRGKPVVVGALPGRRGVVSACSYEARAFGIHSAMPISRALELCPHAAFLPVRFERYRELSKRVMAIFSDFTPDVRQISVDEAFLDMSGTEGLFGPPRAAAAAVKARVRAETGLTVSVGGGANRYVAKLASAFSKPDGLLVIDAGREEEFLDSVPLSRLWGVGGKTFARLSALGIDTVPRLRALSPEALERAAGKAGAAFLAAAARGLDPGIFGDEPQSRSMSAETTFERDVTGTEALEAVLLEQAQELMFRLMEEGLRSRTVHLKLRYEDFETTGIQETFAVPFASADEIFSRAKTLLAKKREEGRAVRLIGLAVANVGEDRGAQGELFASGSEKVASVERAVLDLRRRKGAVVTRARLLQRPPK
ncbi:MAG TPA: DNA polymerase IV [Treponema sp.]|nr:MAG: hypothetical protein A2001_00885 [Treponema sp. GWC1_61_84]OHE68686.1 MAG: hypothetical protein A2413_09325 [Treponema sp. RIFOXYC1_FULL_61_9]HCM28003.1 DNA polymerase IV [Treponema sp.]